MWKRLFGSASGEMRAERPGTRAERGGRQATDNRHSYRDFRWGVRKILHVESYPLRGPGGVLPPGKLDALRLLLGDPKSSNKLLRKL